MILPLFIATRVYLVGRHSPLERYWTSRSVELTDTTESISMYWKSQVKRRQLALLDGSAHCGFPCGMVEMCMIIQTCNSAGNDVYVEVKTHQ